MPHPALPMQACHLPVQACHLPAPLGAQCVAFPNRCPTRVSEHSTHSGQRDPAASYTDVPPRQAIKATQRLDAMWAPPTLATVIATPVGLCCTDNEFLSFSTSCHRYELGHSTLWRPQYLVEPAQRISRCINSDPAPIRGFPQRRPEAPRPPLAAGGSQICSVMV